VLPSGGASSLRKSVKRKKSDLLYQERKGVRLQRKRKIRRGGEPACQSSSYGKREDFNTKSCSKPLFKRRCRREEASHPALAKAVGVLGENGDVSGGKPLRRRCGPFQGARKSRSLCAPGRNVRISDEMGKIYIKRGGLAASLKRRSSWEKRKNSPMRRIKRC